MLTLGVDTSEAIGGVALFEEGAIAEECLMAEPLRHAESLFPLIDRILDENKLSREQIDRVGFQRGPGSFTGLRIGLAAAKGFCQARKIPLVGVDGMHAYRARIPETRRVCVVVASRRDLVYAQAFTGARPKGAIRLLREVELVEELRREERELVLVGSGAASVFGLLQEHPMLHLAPDAVNRPSPLSVARLGAADEQGDRLYLLEPLYVEAVLA